MVFNGSRDVPGYCLINANLFIFAPFLKKESCLTGKGILLSTNIHGGLPIRISPE
jgi:hypothetical protein